MSLITTALLQRYHTGLLKKLNGEAEPIVKRWSVFLGPDCRWVNYEDGRMRCAVKAPPEITANSYVFNIQMGEGATIEEAVSAAKDWEYMVFDSGDLMFISYPSMYPQEYFGLTGYSIQTNDTELGKTWYNPFTEELKNYPVGSFHIGGSVYPRDYMGGGWRQISLGIELDEKGLVAWQRTV